MRVQLKGNTLMLGPNLFSQTGIHGHLLLGGLIQMLMCDYLWVEGKNGEKIHVKRRG